MYEGTKVVEKLWLIVYDNKDEEEVNISKLAARQRLYWREQQYDTEGNTKPKAKVSTPSTAKKKNTTRKKAAQLQRTKKNAAPKTAIVAKKTTVAKNKIGKALTKKQQEEVDKQLPLPKLKIKTKM